MKKRKYHRVGFTAAQSAELWERWKAGEDLHAIARALGKWHSGIASHLGAQRRDKTGGAATLGAGVKFG